MKRTKSYRKLLQNGKTICIQLMLILALINFSNQIIAQEAIFRINSNGNTDGVWWDIYEDFGFMHMGVQQRHHQPDEAGITMVKVPVSSLAIFAVGDGSVLVVCPGDSIAFHFDSAAGKYVVEGGKYPIHLDLITRLRQLTDAPRWFKRGEMDVYIFKEQLEVGYLRQQIFLDSLYHQVGLREDVYQLVSELIKNEYLMRLLSPINKENVAQYWPLMIGEQEEQILAYMQSAIYPNGRSYFVSVESFLRNRAHISQHEDATYYVFDQILSSGFDPNNQVATLHDIFVTSGGVGKMDKANLKDVYRRMRQFTFDKTKQERIDRIYQEAIVEGSIIPASVLDDTQLLSSTGETLSLRELLSTVVSSEKVLLIDFWASWCGPCIAGLPAVKEFTIKHSDQVEVVYFSVDDDASKWKNSYETHSIVDNQYLVSGHFKSPLAKHIALTGIPRYAIIGKDFSLHLLEALKMAEYKLKELL